MGLNDTHRLQPPVAQPTLLCFDCPRFSSFRFLNANFPKASTTIHRAFSVARMANCHTLVIEVIDAIGLLKEDNIELAMYGGKSNDLIFRISFWKTSFHDKMTVDALCEHDLVGYLIIKKDLGNGFQSGRTILFDEWYVFEGVFAQISQSEHYITPLTTYNVVIGSKVYALNGVLYCQQNAINKCCAQVALRSLLSRMMPDNDISYKTINNYAKFIPSEGSPMPGSGLSLSQIHDVLSEVGVKYDEYNLNTRVPGYYYQKCIYDGVESGIGSLLFLCYGDNGSTKHVLPVYGHTFNSNTWVPDAESSYFMMGNGVGYMPSDLWTDDFLAHDDNFGCNFSIPRKHIAEDNAFWVISLHKQGDCLSPRIAEGASLFILSVWSRSLDSTNIWNNQIVQLLPSVPNESIQPRFVFRTVSVSKADYLEYISKEIDGRGNKEAKSVLDALHTMDLPQRFLVVELSLPQLFPANKRKIGEFIFDVSKETGDDVALTVKNAFCFGRMPGEYLYPDKGGWFMRRKSRIVDHTKLLNT